MLRTKIVTFALAFLFASLPAKANPPILWGQSAKILANGLDLNGNAQMLSGTQDPSSTATLAAQGSLFLRTGASGGSLFTKQDNGSTTNWQKLLGGVTLPISIANGGTGQATQQAALNALSGTQSSGKYLRSDGTNTSLSSLLAADVPTLNQNTTGTAANVTGTVAIANGGTGQTTKTPAFDALSPNSTKGDLTIFNGTNNVRQPAGSDGQVLIYDSNDPKGARPANFQVINFLSGANSDLESTVGSWAAYSNTAQATPVTGTGGAPSVTCTRTTTSPLRGSGSLLVTKDAVNRQGQGCAVGFSIASADEAKPLTVSFSYLVGSGTFQAGSSSQESDLEVYLYDTTNSAVIQPAGYKLTCNSTTNACVYQGSFQSAYNSASYRLIFHVATTNTAAWALKVDDISISPIQRALGNPITDWVSFTPVYGGTTTAPTFNALVVNSARWRRVGDSMEIRYDLQQTSSAGTAAGTGSYLMSLPPGFSIDTNKITAGSGSGIGAVGVAALGYAGGAYEGQVQTYDGTRLAVQLLNLAAGAGAILNFGSSDTPITGSGTINFSMLARVPILGWGSSVVMSNDSDTRVVAARGYAPSTLAVTANSPIVWPNTDFDTHGGFSGGRYTVQVPGYYRVHLELYSSTATNTMIYKNGAVVSEGSATTASSPAAVTDMLQLVAGDIIDARTNGSVTLGSGTGNVNHFTIERLSGPAAIAASETIAAKYFMSGSGVVGSGAPFNFDSKVFDTHGAVTTGSGWKFTAPVSGLFEVSFVAQAQSATQTSVYLSVNGSSINYLGQTSVANAFANGTTVVKLSAGDYLDLRPDSNISYGGGSTLTWITVRKIGNY